MFKTKKYLDENRHIVGKMLDKADAKKIKQAIYASPSSLLYPTDYLANHPREHYAAATALTGILEIGAYYFLPESPSYLFFDGIIRATSGLLNTPKATFVVEIPYKISRIFDERKRDFVRLWNETKREADEEEFRKSFQS